jgi:hypothetical protein
MMWKDTDLGFLTNHVLSMKSNLMITKLSNIFGHLHINKDQGHLSIFCDKHPNTLEM